MVIQRSAGPGRKVNPGFADEVFADHDIPPRFGAMRQRLSGFKSITEENKRS